MAQHKLFLKTLNYGCILDHFLHKKHKDH